jgi:hypothetical protein
VALATLGLIGVMLAGTIAAQTMPLRIGRTPTPIQPNALPVCPNCG